MNKNTPTTDSGLFIHRFYKNHHSHLIGSKNFDIHSFQWQAAIGWSEATTKYFSSIATIHDLVQFIVKLRQLGDLSHQLFAHKSRCIGRLISLVVQDMKSKLMSHLLQEDGRPGLKVSAFAGNNGTHCATHAANDVDQTNMRIFTSGRAITKYTPHQRFQSYFLFVCSLFV